MSITTLRTVILGIFCLIGIGTATAQCELYDGNGVPSMTPQWLSCFGTNYTLVLQSPNTLGAWTVDWGDGSPIDSGPDLVPPASVSHTYTAAVAVYTVTFTETATGCTVIGEVIMEEPSNASIQIPVGGVTQACAPAILEFTNSSTDVSSTTMFTWDFGDGSPLEVYGDTNAGQTVQHQYLQGTVDCETVVTLTAENVCNTSQGGPSVATFNPIRIWDLDDAQIAATATLLCYPDTTVDLTNVTDRNCLAQGNTFQRQEYWNFGDYWGLGYDSIIDWTPWPPTFPHTLHYPGIGTYTAMLIDSNFCGQDTAYITIDIVPPPTANFSVVEDTVCVGEDLTTINLSGGGANDWWWNFGDGTGWQNTGNGNQTHQYVAPGDYTVQLVANILGGTVSCTDTISLPVHVLPSPTPQIIIDNNDGCDTLTVNFTDGSIGTIVQWDWDFGNGNTSTLQNPGSQFYNAPNNYNVSLTVTSDNGCPATINTTINVYQSPSVLFTPTSVCQDAIAQFTDQSTSAPGDPIISWTWDFGNGDNSTQQNPSTTYTATGTFNIDLEVSTAHCTARDTISVTVEPTPTAAFTQDVTDGCPILTVNFTNNSTGAVQYDWDFGDGTTSTLQNPTHNFTNLGTTDAVYTVMMIASTTFGCADTAYQTITVYPAVSASFTHNGFTGCAPLPVDFTNTTGPGATFEWDFGDGTGSTDTNTSHIYINSSLFIDVYTVQLIATSPNGCADTATDDITVYPLPDFSFSSVPDSGCSPLLVNFPSVLGAVQYDWDFGDGNTASGPSPSHTYVNSTTNDVQYTVELIALSPFGCADTNYGVVTVFPNPTAQMTSDITDGCSPLTVTFENTSLGGSSFNWDYDDGNTSNDTNAFHTHTFINTGSAPIVHEVELIVFTDKGCPDTATVQITVYPEVTAAFTSDTAGCSPLPICFNNTSINAATYNWSFGDGQVDVATDPCHTYVNSGLTNVALQAELIATSTHGCADTATQFIYIHALPIAQYSLSSPNGCNPFPLTIQNTSLGAVNYYWDYGDGNTSTTNSGSHVHNYSNPGGTTVTYDLELIAETNNGCRDTTVTTISVYPEVHASYTADSAGCHPKTVCFFNTSLNEDSYNWDFGDGIVDVVEHPCHTFNNLTNQDTTFTVTYIATSVNGCSDTATSTVFVYPIPSAAFTATPVNQTFPNTTVTITNTSSGGSWNYDWQFGDGADTNVIDPVDHSYSTWGTYDIQLVVYSPFCADTSTQTIVIDPPDPIVDFYGSDSGCFPVTIQFIDSSEYVDTYFWDFGDGGVSSVPSPLYTYNVPGTYSPTLTVTGPGGVATLTKFDSVVVHPHAQAFFQYAPDEVFVPGTPVQFFNLSSMADTYYWDFGDGNFSNAQHPVWEYADEGTYTVMLIADNEFNCPDTHVVENAILAKLGGTIDFPNAFTPDPNGSTGGYYDPNSFSNDVFFPVFEGVEDYHLQIFNRWGELIFESTDINIGWDGYYRDQLAQSDVYVWKVRARFTNGDEQTKVGELHLIR